MNKTTIDLDDSQLDTLYSIIRSAFQYWEYECIEPSEDDIKIKDLIGSKINE